MGPAPRLTVRVLVAVGLLLGAWASLGAMDVATQWVQRRAEAVAPPPPAEASGPLPPGRAFVLLIDSLRADRARAMPTLRALSREGLFVDVTATADAATVPSLRAAFTGEAQRSIFVVARNFLRTSRALPSVLSQLAEEGGRATVFSDGSFYELAPGAATLRDNEEAPGDEETQECRAFSAALARYREGDDRLVIFHLTTIDHVAHVHPVGGAAYARAFEVADGLVRQAVDAISPDDTLVVMGDHGHDGVGRHFPGLRVPTVALYRGPRFRAGKTQGPVPLTAHRYLLSWALGLSLPPEYRGVAAPSVLAGVPPPPAFVSRPPEISSVASWGQRALATLPLVLALALGAAAWEARRGRRLRRSFALALSVAVFFVAWGALLAHRRAETLPPSGAQLLAAWGLGVVAAVALAWRGRRDLATWLALALPALLLYPSAGWEGWGAVMGPAWLVALVALAVDWGRRRAPGPLGHAETRGLAALLAVAALVTPFFYRETDGFIAQWRGYLSSTRLTYWVVLGAFAKVVIFLPPRGRRGTVADAIALELVAIFSLVSFGGMWPSSVGRLAAAAFLASAAFMARGLAPRLRSCAALAPVLATAALLMLYRATVSVDERELLQLELLLAALVLSARAAALLGSAEDRPWFTAWLEAMAVLVAAWTSLGLTLYRLEWRFLFPFFSPPVLEARVGWLLPVIVGRYALPLVLARHLLAQARPRSLPGTWPVASTALAAKLATLVLVTLGAAIWDPTGEPFLGAVQNVLALSALALALVYEPRTAARRALVS